MTAAPGYSADCKRIANHARALRKAWLRTGDAQTAMLALDAMIADVDRQRKARAAAEPEIPPAGAQVGPIGAKASPDQSTPTRGAENRLSVDHHNQERSQ
ncbi:hypothetical protein ACFSDD_11100 [Salipiger marinus]|uniref:hypothetical protein n=1 Tax=Salipiger marinus TaxID=555512 RepID=UPI002BC91556|nr:hypothetical protein [Salipiger manganoxidans]MEB3419918.1 hypothetical protein [Salipiger manganoxidans]